MNKFFLKYILSLPIIYLGLYSMDISAQQEIEEIVVSATKRDQSLQDVNIAVNAFNNEDLNQLNWDDITNTLKTLRSYIKKNNLWYGIGSDFEYSSEILIKLKDVVDKLNEV